MVTGITPDDNLYYQYCQKSVELKNCKLWQLRKKARLLNECHSLREKWLSTDTGKSIMKDLGDGIMLLVNLILK